MIWINGGFSAAGRESITTQPLHLPNTTVSQSVISQWFNEDQVICETRIFSRHIPMNDGDC